MATKKQNLTVKEQRLLALKIPEMATEIYLERLAVNITQQLREIENKQVKEHLQTMLQEIQARLARLREESEESPTIQDLQDISEESLVASDERVVKMEGEGETVTLRATGETGKNYLMRLIERIVTKLNTAKDEKEKERLQRMLQEVQRWIKKYEEVPKEEKVCRQDVNGGKTLAFYNTINLSQREREIVKNRLADILHVLEKQRETGPSSEPTEIELGPELEVTETPAEIELGPEMEVQPEVPAKLTEAYGELFEKICQQIGNGDSIDLFYDIELSERERRMLKAFAMHLSSYKGLRRQQVFDLQHLTSKSIGELEQIFKTYQPQGYLNVELHGIYNRLLMLRSRFSSLLY